VLFLRMANRALAVLLSLAVVVGAVLLTVEVVRWAMGESPWLVQWHGWGETLASLRAGDREVLLASTVAALVGVALLWFELAPRGPKTLPTAPLADGVTTVTTRRGLAVATETAARNVSGVRSVSVDAGKRRVSVRARVRARGVAHEVEDGVRSEVEKTLQHLQLQRIPKVRVSVEEDG
jgi:hypothetical protein